MPSHRDTDFVSYKSKGGGKFEIFTHRKVAGEFRKKYKGDVSNAPNDMAAICLDPKMVYRNIKKLKRASTEDILEEFGTDDMDEVAKLIVLKGSLKVKVYVHSPLVEFLLDSLFFIEILGTIYWINYREDNVFFYSMVGVVSILVAVTLKLCRTLGRYLSSKLLANPPFNNPLQGDVALRQFESQVWQLVIHTSMAALAIYAYRDGVDFINEPHRYVEAWQFMGSPFTYWVKILYLTQLAVWFVTCTSLRFFEVRAGDHYVMYSHHVITIGVVLTSYAYGRYSSFGLVVFMLHDFSDVPLDVMKLLNLLRIEERAGFYGAEIAYLTLMPIWAYCRLYLFPDSTIGNIFRGMFYSRDENGNEFWCTGLRSGQRGKKLIADGYQWIVDKSLKYDCGLTGGSEYSSILYNRATCGGTICAILLTLLLCLHIWWTYLLLRIGYRAIVVGENTHSVSNEEYFEENGGDSPKSASRKKNE